jgi:hypothetical protein
MAYPGSTTYPGADTFPGADTPPEPPETVDLPGFDATSPQLAALATDPAVAAFELATSLFGHAEAGAYGSGPYGAGEYGTGTGGASSSGPFTTSAELPSLASTPVLEVYDTEPALA